MHLCEGRSAIQLIYLTTIIHHHYLDKEEKYCRLSINTLGCVCCLFVCLFLWRSFGLLVGFFPNQLTTYRAKFVGINFLAERPILVKSMLLNSLNIKNTGWLHSIWVFAGFQTNWKMSLTKINFKLFEGIVWESARWPRPKTYQGTC